MKSLRNQKSAQLQRMKKRQEKIDTEELTCKLSNITRVLKEMKADVRTRKVIAKNETKGRRRGRAPA